MEKLRKFEAFVFDADRIVTTTGEDYYTLTCGVAWVGLEEVEYGLRGVFEVTLLGAILIFGLLV